MKTLFDGTTPATMTSGGSGSAGTSLTAAHRDHTHPFTNPAIDTLAAGTDITTLNASTTAHGLVVKAVAPAANALNVVGIANAETAYTNKTILTTTTPSTQAFGDSAAAGTNLDAAHSDHKHAMPASPKDTTAQTGILKGNGSTISAVTAPTGTIVGTLDSQALTNKTYESYSINATPTANNIPVLDANAFLPKAAVQSIATVTVSNVTTSVAINADITGTYEITAQAGAVLFSNPTGTLVNNQKLIIKIIDNGTARAITWGTNFRAMGTALPSTTVLSKHLVMGFIYNITDTKWDCVAANYEA